MSTTVSSSAMRDARELLRNAPKVLVITGAGMSAESGVPTFRGEGELWNGRHFTELATFDAFTKNPRFIWDWYLYRRSVVARCEPNAGHIALSRWARSRKEVMLITQNVDGLHERAAHPDVRRVHGSLWHNRCTVCGLEREDRSLLYVGLPLSPCCHALERPAIIWMDELLPTKIMKDGNAWALRSAVVLVVGTSGTVNTAHTLVRYGKLTGAKIVDINLEETSIPADYRCLGSAVDLLPKLLPQI